ncbi:glycine--tRNA ligase subunit beta [Paraglaciecola sp. MB-3u-78]|jgi:glycyl-tRNA synthetase beta chain|uniref:glycine--tRNA ligase subunit beta n=1 Tax=Paraglaciecola sp. MB-3u-78 TaxID=2058332 RepID=UPI000C33C924|nr:glycine--tRNA ligase subunit beta [Paraglaciecola sp. MB-3u-78]PKG97909.1 glycine--tRNA ligase subunit beta [Paraglaciecola sp. MB-3u-78]
MRTDNLLIEIGTEELPPKSLAKLALAFRENIQTGFSDNDLTFSHVNWYASPRRLAVLVDGLSEFQADKDVEKRGPAVSAAFDQNDEPTKAAQGWARSNGIEVHQAERLKTDKGEWLLFKAQVKGLAIKELLAELVEKALKALPIPKPMRWGTKSTQFIRPIHTITMLYGTDLIQGKVLDVSSARLINGHRFHCDAPFELDCADNYLSQLEQHFVIADHSRRKSIISEQIQALAKQENATPDVNEELLDEVTSLVEWPVALIANFDESFLAVPKEALIYTMKDDQKYFPLLDEHGQLKSRFIFITNIESKDPGTIISGNEKVIRPRLADAEFFFNTDKKQTLESRLESLKMILFQKQLGTLYEKSERIASMAKCIAVMLGTDQETAYRAGLLCKTDLMTNMVMEFPDVQGLMGMHYARLDGESELVALAQNEQYMPRFAGDNLPASEVSVCVALADKIDTLVGIFGIGQIPKGDKDPFALRRAAIGVLRIIVDKTLPLDLSDLVDASISTFGDKIRTENLQIKVIDFILARFKAWYAEQGIATGVVQAVAVNRPTRPADFAARVEAVKSFNTLESADSLAAANKRVANILAKNVFEDKLSFNKALLLEPAEIALASNLESVEARIKPMLAQSDYTNALVVLAELRQPIDEFFETVMVMAEDESVKRNRLTLLSRLRGLFLCCADISVLN